MDAAAYSHIGCYDSTNGDFKYAFLIYKPVTMVPSASVSATLTWPASFPIF